MNLYQEMIALRDLAAQPSMVFQLDDLTPFVVIRRGADGETRTVITPTPKSGVVPTKMGSNLAAMGITLEQTDILVQGISKRYERDVIVGVGISYLVRGREYHFLAITENLLTWDLVLRPVVSENLSRRW